METTGRQTAAMVLGIVGGVFGILGALAAMLVGGIGAAFESEGSAGIAAMGFVSVFLAVAGIVGGALVRTRQDVGFGLMLTSGIAGFVTISMAWALAGPLLIVGAFLGRSRGRSAPPAADHSGPQIG